MRENTARVDEEPSEIDTLIADLERARNPAPPKVVTPKVTKPDGPRRFTITENGTRKGGVPKFFKHEVEAIREDERPLTDIAHDWACSFDTILRVRQQGRFADVPYIARDELDMAVDPVSGLIANPPAREMLKENKRGRPFKSGRRDPVTAVERAQIAQDPRHAQLVASDYKISRAYVNQIRREMGTTLLHRAPLTKSSIDQIRADGRRYEDIAHAFRVPIALVRWIKGERTHEAAENEG